MAVPGLLSALTIRLLDRVVEKGLLERLFPFHEIVCKADDLKTVVTSDEPNMQLTPVLLIGRNLDEARVTRHTIDGSIGARCPATRSGKVSRPHSRWLVVRDLFNAR